MLTARPAAMQDLPGIMEVETETFGPIGDDATASQKKMQQRIELLNADSARTWFWVVKDKDTVLGDVVLQPTRLSPDDCTSWEAATDNGTLATTYCKEGPNVYVVSMAVSQRAPRGAADLLIHAAFTTWACFNPGYFMFCSRMPGFKEAHGASGISVEEYFVAKRKDMPRDAMLRRWWKVSGGVFPARLLKNGFPPDEESGGHGALFALTNPERALHATASILYESGIALGEKK